MGLTQNGKVSNPAYKPQFLAIFTGKWWTRRDSNA